MVEDANGVRLLSNGVVADPRDALRPDTHSYRAVGLDRADNPIQRHDLWNQVTTAYRRSIPAGGYDIARYHMVIPSTSQNNHSEAAALRLTARLRYRAVRPDFAAWALAGAGANASIPPAPSLTTSRLRRIH